MSHLYFAHLSHLYIAVIVLNQIRHIMELRGSLRCAFVGNAIVPTVALVVRQMGNRSPAEYGLVSRCISCGQPLSGDFSQPWQLAVAFRVKEAASCYIQPQQLLVLKQAKTLTCHLNHYGVGSDKALNARNYWTLASTSEA